MAAIEVFSRVEHKYMINNETYIKLREQLKEYMYEDGFSAEGGFYTICNIYYDTDTDELIRKSIEKPVYKEKLRLRSYGRADHDTKVFLEIKKKYKGVVNKRRTVLKLDEAYEFASTYEQPAYEHLMKITPKAGALVETKEGKGIVTESNLITGVIKVRLDKNPDAAPSTYNRKQVKILRDVRTSVTKEEMDALKAIEEN